MAHDRSAVQHALRFVVVIAAALGAFPLAASAEGFFPLEEGIIWRYDAHDDIQGWHESRHFLGSTTVNGTVAHIQHYVGGPYDGLEEYWSENAEGDVLYHGFSLQPVISIIYSPPILWYDFPLFVGKSWRTSPSQIDLQFEVVEQASITVPGGTFECFKIQRTRVATKTSFPTKDVANRGSMPAGREGWEWVAAGTGLVESITSWEQFRLRAVDTLTDVQPTTWSAIRQFYR